jgi:hypothetical protein
MTMSDLAARLDVAADDLAGMRAELAAESGFAAFGRGAAEQLAAHLTEAWHARHDELARVGDALSALAADVRLASGRYESADAAGADEMGAAWMR